MKNSYDKKDIILSVAAISSFSIVMCIMFLLLAMSILSVIGAAVYFCTSYILAVIVFNILSCFGIKYNKRSYRILSTTINVLGSLSMARRVRQHAVTETKQQWRPENWSEEPDEFYGVDKNGCPYYRYGDDVYRTIEGYTDWLGTTVDWEYNGRKFIMSGDE